MSGMKHTDEKGKKAEAQSKVAKKLRKEMAKPVKGGHVKVKVKIKGHMKPEAAKKMLKGLK
jgi:hypothetical protein